VQTANILAYRRGQNAVPNGGSENFSVDNLNVSSSYAVLDSGYKFMFDRFNDVFRYVPLSGDIAGLAVRSDFETETWFSPAGFNRGQLRDVVKLALNPKQIQRDQLYSNGINPVVSFPGQGTLLFGDKTMLAKPSAFDRINVRRLFIVLEKAIATAAKFQLFEFNDSFTRAQFKSLIEPFLLDVQSRRGIIDFKVVCDESNNTPEIIDRNEFVADIFIKPNRSINFITLNFIATRTGVNFDEIAGLAN
jgi:phage tail sheath protein FI